MRLTTLLPLLEPTPDTTGRYRRGAVRAAVHDRFTVESGTTLQGKYRIDRVLGRGGIGVVVRAHHIDLDEPVAIKLLRPDKIERTNAVLRFVREAQAAAKLKNEHICRVLDIGKLDDGAPYLVMEYMEGTDLRGLLRRFGRLTPCYAVDLVLQACVGMAEAHSVGIVHRDIKPSNLFASERSDGEALLKVLDFGISKAPIENNFDMTHSGAILGTPSYMSPEQIRASKHVDARADLWALGVVLYELVSGKRPFRSRVFTKLCVEVATEEPQPLDVELPPGLAAAIFRCLEKDPGCRYQNVAELAADLAAFANVPQQARRVAERCARILGLVEKKQTTELSGLVRRSGTETVADPLTVIPAQGTPIFTFAEGEGQRIAESEQLIEIPATSIHRTPTIWSPRNTLIVCSIGFLGLLSFLAIWGDGIELESMEPASAAAPDVAASVESGADGPHGAVVIDLPSDRSDDRSEDRSNDRSFIPSASLLVGPLAAPGYPTTRDTADPESGASNQPETKASSRSASKAKRSKADPRSKKTKRKRRNSRRSRTPDRDSDRDSQPSDPLQRMQW